jgi:hypothetical protein
VTRRLRACNPVVKDQHPGSASIPRARFEPRSGGCRGSRRFTRFDPRRVHRSGVHFRRGVRPTSLWRSWCLHGDRLCSEQPPRRPHAALPAHRVNGGARAGGRGAPSDDEERPGALPLLTLPQEAAVPFRRLAGAARLDAWERARPRPRSLFGHRTRRADLCNRRETRAHPRGDPSPRPRRGYPRSGGSGLEPAGGEHGRSHTHPPYPVPKRVHGCTEAPMEPGTGTLVAAPAVSECWSTAAHRSHQGRRCSPARTCEQWERPGCLLAGRRRRHRWCRLPHPDGRDHALFIYP